MSPKSEHSFGIIPLQKHGQKDWHVLLIQHGKAKYWGYPKGHAEEGESPRQAAERELKEETNLFPVCYLSEQVLEEHYQFRLHGALVSKTVTFFIAEVAGELQLQDEEVSGYQWVMLDSAEEVLTYETDKSLLRAVKILLSDTQHL